MRYEDYLSILHTVGRLKDTTRHSWTAGGRHESVAEHTFRLCAMAYFLGDEFPEADMHKVMLMCLIHDFGEIFTGDIPSFDKTAADEETEEARLSAWVDTLPEGYRDEMRALYAEMEARETTEAKLYKALDGMEAVLTHNEADLSTWTELERSLNLTYAAERTGFSSWLAGLRAALRAETEAKLAADGGRTPPMT